MAIYTFKYSDCPINPSPAFPSGLIAKRPVVEISFPGCPSFTCLAMIDSGADFTMFPEAFMQTLGLDPATAPLGRVSGVGSTDYAPFHSLKMFVGNSLELDILAGFSEKLNDWNIGLLGQYGFFDRANVSFDFRNGTVVVQTHDP